jgi:hypothetical protein
MTDGWSAGDSDVIERISEHVERHVGPITEVWHEIVSDDLHIDVHHVAPGSGCDFHVLVTSGMSARPMTVPSECEEFAYAEMVAVLPADWPISQEAFEDENNYWPVRLIKRLARYPHEHGSWLGFGHTIANEGDPPEAFAPSTKQNAVVILPPLSLAEDFASLETGVGAQTIRFWAAIPLYWEELQLKLQSGSDGLLAAFDKHRVGDVIDPARPNVARSKRFRLF